MAARRYKIFLRMSKENFGGETSSLTKTSTVKGVLSALNGKRGQEREKIREISDRSSLYILTVSLDFLNCYDIEVIVEHLLTCISLLSLTLDLMYESLL